MCNLYSITTNQAAIIALFRGVNRYVRNLPPTPGDFRGQGRELPRAPRTDPYGPNSGIRLPPRVCNGAS